MLRIQAAFSRSRGAPSVSNFRRLNATSTAQPKVQEKYRDNVSFYLNGKKVVLKVLQYALAFSKSMMHNEAIGKGHQARNDFN